MPSRFSFFCFLLQSFGTQWRNILPLDLVRAQDPVTKSFQRLEYLPGFQSYCYCVTYYNDFILQQTLETGYGRELHKTRKDGSGTGNISGTSALLFSSLEAGTTFNTNLGWKDRRKWVAFRFPTRSLD